MKGVRHPEQKARCGTSVCICLGLFELTQALPRDISRSNPMPTEDELSTCRWIRTILPSILCCVPTARSLLEATEREERIVRARTHTHTLIAHTWGVGGCYHKTGGAKVREWSKRHGKFKAPTVLRTTAGNVRSRDGSMERPSRGRRALPAKKTSSPPTERLQRSASAAITASRDAGRTLSQARPRIFVLQKSDLFLPLRGGAAAEMMRVAQSCETHKFFARPQMLMRADR